MIKHPASAIYGTLLLISALYSSITGVFSGAWDTAAVDLIMAFALVFSMLKNIRSLEHNTAERSAKITAWAAVIGANLLMLIPANSFSGDLLRAISFTVLFNSILLHFCGFRIALYALPATLWCGIFIPFHEEIMLMASYPLRLSATMLSALSLKLCGVDVVYSGSSLHLPDLNIAITDACSGINQLDAFLLIAYVAVKIMQKKELIQLLHFAFIIPAVIIANTLRIVATVLLFNACGDVILGKFWHVALGYVQIIAALLIFLAVGKLFISKPEKKQEENS